MSESNTNTIEPEPEKTEVVPETPVSESIEIKLSQSYCQILKNTAFYPHISKIVHWNDPVRSGLLFGIWNFFFFLITWGNYSLLTLVSYLLLSIVLSSFCYANFVVYKALWLQKKQVPNPLKERFGNAKWHIPRKTANQITDSILDFSNLTIDYLREAVYAQNILFSLKFAALLYFMAQIGNWFSDPCLIYLVGLIAFVWPKLYQEKQKEIDHAAELAKSHIKKYVDLALSKIPPHVSAKIGLKSKEN